MAGLERALPASWYLSDERFQRERERLLFGEWFCAGRADQVERPGSLVVVDVAGESVLLVRTRAGELAAHYNVCRHRGSQVVPCPPAAPGGPQATPTRKAGSLRCPYHSWTYRLEGDLLRAPWSEEIDGFDQEAFGLHPVGVATWGGFVFLHLTPGRAVPQVVEVAGESVLLVRTRAGELRAHYNVCRHRGSQVVPCPPAPPGGPQAGPARKAGSLRCPYHSWTYRLEGDLLRAPWSEEIDGFDQAAFGLHPVGVATWGGFVFLHLTPGEAVPLADQLGPVPERLRRYPLEALAVGRRLAYQVGANWKLVAENYNECYHCAGVHPELCRVVPAFKRGGAGLDWDRGIPHREGAWTFTATGQSDRAPFPGLDDDERTRHKGELVYPNLMLSLSADHVAAFTLWPHGPDRDHGRLRAAVPPRRAGPPRVRPLRRGRLLGPVTSSPLTDSSPLMRRLGGFLLRRRLPSSLTGLTPAPQAFWVSASPAATRMLRAAFGVAVVNDPAGRADPDAHAERLGAVPVPARRAGLRGRLPAADLDDPTPVLCGLLLQQPDEVAHPASWTLLANRVRAKPRHAQLLDGYLFVLADQPQGELVVLILPPVSHSPLRYRYPHASPSLLLSTPFAFPPAALCSLAEPPLRRSQVPLVGYLLGGPVAGHYRR